MLTYQVKASLSARQMEWMRNLIPSATMAAIISRETEGIREYCIPPHEGGRLGDNLHGHGPGQIDDRSFPEWCADWRAGKHTVADGINMATLVLEGKLFYLRRHKITALKAAVAAYNCGEGNVRKLVQTNQDVDSLTEHHNYAVDVMARREWFVTNWGLK